MVNVPTGAEGSRLPGTGASADDLRLVAALLNGDEAAFVSLLERYHTAMVRLATIYVADRAVAEEVVQETWLSVLQGLGRFEARSSLKTWILRILTNRAKTRGRREGRSISFSTLGDMGAPAEFAVAPERFLPADHPREPGHWVTFPRSWPEIPEDRVLAHETLGCIRQAIAALPPGQREVITLRDVEEWAADDVCNVLGISETNQRVLLHRARSKVRRALEQYFTGE